MTKDDGRRGLSTPDGPGPGEHRPAPGPSHGRAEERDGWEPIALGPQGVDRGRTITHAQAFARRAQAGPDFTGAGLAAWLRGPQPAHREAGDGHCRCGNEAHDES